MMSALNLDISKRINGNYIIFDAALPKYGSVGRAWLRAESVRREIYLTEIQTYALSRGKGFGSALLNAVCEFADEHGARLALWVCGDSEDDDLRLAAWYRRHGFDCADPDVEEMVRQPSRKSRKPWPWRKAAA